ncbi:MAG TPA: polysaccharide biosynthesis/export family protein [Blastocatellia bacterium]|nr:polysaccharide biosynthesis/export family protein [Blastocatellia bacterium]
MRRQPDICQDAWIQRTFNVAYLLHPEKLMAWCVTRDGQNRVPFIRQLEAKRRRKYKMETPDEALLQVGVFYASDAWERNQENEAEKREPRYEPTADDKLVRYLKCIVMETMHRDSANVAVGLGCLLYTYSPSEICNIAPDLFDGDNIRRDKKRIADTIKDRFGNRTDATPLKTPSETESALTKESLKILAPWVQSHPLPTDQAVTLLEIYFHRETAPLDWKRNHILIDPECGGLPRLICEFNDQLPPAGDDMRLDDPEKKLSVPLFDGSGNNNENDRFSPPTLTPYDLHLLKDSVKHQERRRKSFVSGLIRVHLDGKELTRFEANTGQSDGCRISRIASYVEVFGQDGFGDLLLAFFPLSSLNCFDPGEPSTLEIRVEGGQRVQCLITPETDEHGEIISGLLQIKYQAPKLNLTRIWGGLQSLGRESILRWPPRLALAFSLLTVCALYLGHEYLSGSRSEMALLIPDPDLSTPKPSPKSTPGPTPKPKQKPSPKSTQKPTQKNEAEIILRMAPTPPPTPGPNSGPNPSLQWDELAKIARPAPTPSAAPDPNPPAQENYTARVFSTARTPSANSESARKLRTRRSSKKQADEQVAFSLDRTFELGEIKEMVDAAKEQMVQAVLRGFIETYRLGPSDALTILVKGRPDYSVEMVKVSPMGTIFHPILGDLIVAGLTTGQLEKMLTKELREYLPDPIVNLSLIEARSAKIGVIGEVKMPGVFVLTGPMTILEAITKSGGFTDAANKSQVIVWRQTQDNRWVKLQVDVQQILEGQKQANLQIQDLDLVIVGGNGIKAIPILIGLDKLTNFLSLIKRGSR